MKTLINTLYHKLNLVLKGPLAPPLPQHDWLRRDLGWPQEDYPSQHPTNHWPFHSSHGRSKNTNKTL